MELSQALTRITNDITISILSGMLDRAHTTISWWGERLVSVEGYEGSVPIDEIAQKYLHLAIDKQNIHLSLQDKLDHYMLWGKIEQLYHDSNTKLSQSFVYKYLVLVKEFRIHMDAMSGSPLSFIRGSDLYEKRTALLEFTPERFEALWPKQFKEVSDQLDKVGEVGKKSFKWVATEEMVSSALKRNVE